MTRLSKIIEELDLVAPMHQKCSWDNVGLLVGDENARIEKVFICLDITTRNVKAAAEFGADLIVSHHPLIFDPLKSVTESNITGSIIRTLVKNNISALCMHTNFDIAEGGMNDILALRLGLEGIRKFTPDECIDENGQPLEGIGRVGTLARPMLLSDFVFHVKDALSSCALKYCGNLGETIQTVAL